MADITASMVKELRERTGSGMMECKKALTETNGDIEAAIDLMRKSGQAKAEKKAGRTAAEGLIVLRQSDACIALLEVNCETDFVTKNEDFLSFTNEVADLVLAQQPSSVEALLATRLRDKTVDEVRKDLISKIGENINVRRFEIMQSAHCLGGYLHGIRIGVAVEMQGGDAALARDLAMHIAASRPICIEASEVPAALIEKERSIYTAKAEESGRPAEIQAKMIEGSMRKFLEEVTLLGQLFVKDQDQSIDKVLKANKATVLRFVRFELGEGIEKDQTDFAAEVMAQAGLA